MISKSDSKGNPSLELIQTLINRLDCSPNDIFGYNEKKI